MTDGLEVYRVRPVDGAIVPFPVDSGRGLRALLPKDGARVLWPGPSSYWARCLQRGMIELVPDTQDETR